MLDEAVAKLERLSEEKLKEFVRSRLLGHLSDPMVAWSQGEQPEWFLEDAYARSGDEFRARLKRVVRDLTVAWQPTFDDDLQYGGRLLYLVGRLRLDGGADILSRLATHPDLDGLSLHGEPLRNVVLRTLLDFPGQQAREEFWEPLLRDPTAFDAAFFAFTLTGSEQGLEHVRAYLDMALNTGFPEPMIEFRLTPFVQQCLSSGLVPSLRRVIVGLEPDRRARVLDILRRAVPEAVERMEAIQGRAQDC
jgi:hypothetical protein